LQSPLDLSDYHLDRDRIVATARNDDVRVAFTRLDEFVVHRLNGGEVLLDDLIERPAADMGVALDAANEPDVGVRVDEHLHVT